MPALPTESSNIPETASRSHPLNGCSAQETAACCCVDVGTIIDNTDCTASYQNVFPSQAEAETALTELTARARKVESDPCAISHEFNDVENGVALSASFIFSCQIESINFQLSLR